MAEKRCVHCGASFEPDPRAWRVVEGMRRCFQKACRRKRCRKKRKLKAQARWLAANPNAFKGRYSNVKSWLDKHPGYLRCYRAANPGYVAADNRARQKRKVRQRRRADIQDAIPRREIGLLRGLQGADIQDTIRRRLDGLLDTLARPPGPIYKSPSLDPSQGR